MRPSLGRVEYQWSLTFCRGLTVGLAYYSHSMLLLSEMGQEGRSKLLVAARDMTIPPVGVSGGSNSLREAVGELEMLVPGIPPSQEAEY